MAPRTHSPASLAGWLFADLSLVLAVAFISTTGNTFAEPSRPADPTVAATTTTTTTTIDNGTSSTTTEPCIDGVSVRPDPVRIVLTDGSSLEVAALHARLDAEIEERKADDPDFSRLIGSAQVTFGVVILYGGSSGQRNEVGDRAAEEAEQRLATWSAILPTTYFETGHNSGAAPGSLTFKMFPVLPDLCEGG